MRKDAWRKLANLFWGQESRINGLLESCTEDTQYCTNTKCREHLEVRRDLLDKLWDIASEQYWYVQELSEDPIDRPYASCIYRA